MCCVILQVGNTPLHEASWEGHLPIIEVLLKNRAEINYTNNVSWHIIDSIISFT